MTKIRLKTGSVTMTEKFGSKLVILFVGVLVSGVFAVEKPTSPQETCVTG